MAKIRPIDPTKTAMLRARFLGEVRKRFKKLKGRINDLIIREDAFGLKQAPANSNLQSMFGIDSLPVRNTRWAFRSDAEKVAEFQKWLALQISSEIIGTQANPQDAFWHAYILQGYQKGAGRAFTDFYKKRQSTLSDMAQLGFFNGTKKDFLQQAFGQPVAIEKVKLLAGRVFSDLKGVTDTMSAQISRELVDGLIQGQSPREVARTINKKVDKIGKVRAAAIARTETIRAHAEGQLDGMEKLGVDTVTAAVEWSTALDGHVCPLCVPLEGVVLKLNEARGMLPRHPNCRCAWRPANVGEKQDKQKRTKASIEKQLRKSKKAEGKKSTFGTKVGKDRPIDDIAPIDTTVKVSKPKKIEKPKPVPKKPSKPKVDQQRPFEVKGYHGTYSRNKEAILKEGFDLSKEGSGFYGKGAYFHTEKTPSKFYGSDIVEAKVTLKNPYIQENFEAFDPDRGSKHLMYLGHPKHRFRPILEAKREAGSDKSWPALVTEHLQDQGYDGVVSWEDGNKIVVAFEKEAIDVIGKKTADKVVKKEAVEKYVPASSRFEAEKWARENVADKVDFSDMSLDQANSINKSLDELQSKVSMDLKLREIRAFTPEEIKRKTASGKTLVADAAGDSLRINPATFTDDIASKNYPSSDISSIQRRLDKAELRAKEFGLDEVTRKQIEKHKKRIQEKKSELRWGVAKTKEDIVTHEIGHTVQTRMVLSDEFGTDFLPPSKLRELNIPFEKTLGSQLDTIAKKEGHKVSEYATTNAEEYWAESFTSVVKGETGKVNPEVESLIRSLLK